MKLIAGDIGGTKTLLRLVNCQESAYLTLAEQRYSSGGFGSFSEMLGKFLAENAVSNVGAACFAVAGPVANGISHVTNLDWTIDARRLEQEFGFPDVSLVNDFYAVARGVPLLRGEDLVTLNRGNVDRNAPIAIVGAGTGLGEAVLFQHSGRWIVLPSEGGHSDFAPSDDEQIDLLRYLRKRFGHVSYERVVSGQGLTNIYSFLSERAGERQSLDAAKIAANASDGDRLSTAALRIFVEAYGAEAGNLALKLLARGGVYLAGGVAPKNVRWFTDGAFMEAFTAKGRFSPLMSEIPVHLILNQQVGLLGAFAIALESVTGR